MGRSAPSSIKMTKLYGHIGANSLRQTMALLGQ
jgi:hypothetical protein